MKENESPSFQDVELWDGSDIKWAQEYLDRSRFKPSGKCLNEYLINHSIGNANFHSMTIIELDRAIKTLPELEKGGYKLIADMTGAWKQRRRRKTKRSVSFELSKSTTDTLSKLAKDNEIPQYQVLTELITNTHEDEKQKRYEAREAKKQTAHAKKRQKAVIETYKKKYNFDGSLMSSFRKVDDLSNQVEELKEKLENSEKALEIARALNIENSQ